MIFPKMYFLDRGRSVGFVTFNIIISHIFPENVIKIPIVVQKVLKFSPLILTIFINFSDFFKFPCYKESNEVSI